MMVIMVVLPLERFGRAFFESEPDLCRRSYTVSSRFYIGSSGSSGGCGFLERTSHDPARRREDDGMTPWLLLGASSLFQVGWLVSLRALDGFRRPYAIVFYAFFGLASTWLLSRSMEKIPLATAYAVWTALSVVGCLLLEIARGRQTGEPLRIAFVLLILAATTGLQITGKTLP